MLKKMFNKITPAVKHISLINIIIYVLSVCLDLFMNIHMTDINQYFGAYCNVDSQFKIYQIFTYMFIHDMNPFHIIFNMFFFLLFAPNFENIYGYRTTVFSYIFLGISSFLFFNFGINQTNTYLIGSSGAVVGFCVAFLFMNFLKIKKIIYNFLVLLLIYEVIMILYSNDFILLITGYGHLGGMVGAILLLLILKIN